MHSLPNMKKVLQNDRKEARNPCPRRAGGMAFLIIKDTVHTNDFCLEHIGKEIDESRLCKLNCVMLYSHSNSSVGERPAPRGRM